MKKKYLLAVGSKFLISAIAVAIIIVFNLLVFKSISWTSVAAISIVISIWDVVELRTELRKIKETCAANSYNIKK